MLHFSEISERDRVGMEGAVIEGKNERARAERERGKMDMINTYGRKVWINKGRGIMSIANMCEGE